jgi:uncharacterized protein YdaT
MAKKTASSKKNGKVHVISRQTGWAVKKEGNTRASKVYKTKNEAVKGARSSSKGRDVVVHKKDGSIERWYQ